MHVPNYYPGIPNLYGETEHDPIKVFLVTRKYAYTALAFAAMDRDAIREGVLNTLDGPNGDGFIVKVNGRKFANDVARNKISVILDEGVDVSGHEIVLIDIVTYPMWHCLITGLDPFVDGNEGLLWKVNHNILAPFIDLIRDCGYPYSFFHFNEEPVDDAPTHNIIAFDVRNPVRQARLPQAMRNLAEKLPNVNIVSETNPIMDDRYCLNQRLPKDPPCGAAPIFRREDMVLSD